MIVVEDLCFDYPGKRALDHVSFTLQPNTITALVGPNGAGKTTLLRCLSALESPMKGKITIENWDTERHPRKIHQLSSYLSDFFGLYDQLTVVEHLQYFAASHHCQGPLKPLIEQTAKRLDLWEYKDITAGKLSRGLRQRLAIAQTIIHQPKILFLDEPASGLDPKARYNLSRLLLTLQKEGMTLIVSSHILAELEDYSTHMIMLQNGKMVKHYALSDYKSGQEAILLKVELTDNAQNYVEIIKTIDNISIQSVENNIILLSFKGKQQDQPGLLKTFIEKNIPVCSMQAQKERMQEVYMNIAKEQEQKDKKKQ